MVYDSQCRINLWIKRAIDQGGGKKLALGKFEKRLLNSVLHFSNGKILYSSYRIIFSCEQFLFLNYRSQLFAFNVALNLELLINNSRKYLTNVLSFRSDCSRMISISVCNTNLAYQMLIKKRLFVIGSEKLSTVLMKVTNTYIFG